MRSWIGIAMLGLGLGLLSARGQEEAKVWYAEEVTTAVSATVGDLCLQIDGDDNQHLAWFYGKDRDLVYAAKVKGTFEVETVESAGSVGLDASLRLDAEGRPHISYTDETKKQVKHAWKQDGKWQIETVYQGKSPRLGTSLQIGTEGRLFVAFYDQGPRDLMLAEKVDGKWTVTTVSSEGDDGLFPQLVLDPAGLPVILYEGDGPTGTLAKVTGDGAPKGDGVIRVARRAADGSWAIQRLPLGQPYARMKLLIDGEGHLSIIAMLQVTGGLCLLRETEGGWAYEPIALPTEKGKLAGEEYSACVASDGSLILYYANAAKQPELALRRDDTWTRYPVKRRDGKSLLMLDSTMAINQGGYVSVAIFQPKVGIINLVGVDVASLE